MLEFQECNILSNLRGIKDHTTPRFHVLATWDHSLDTCPVCRFMITSWSPSAGDDMDEVICNFVPYQFSSVDLLLFSFLLPKHDSK